MTEQEARQKWCPFSRVMVVAGKGDFYVNGNRCQSQTDERGNKSIPGRMDAANCIASDCMAWLTESYELQPDKSQILHGYCGLAGKP